jgi:LPPG:FO 2-phospho-L-lactate transferase
VSRQVVVLTGGVGGAKLVLGLQQVLAPDQLTAIVNTGDDFRHFGLHVSPDLDTLLYTLSSKANQAQGWGREGESWSFMETVRSLGGEDWFALGDGDLALHILRTVRLAQGEPLSVIMKDFCRAWNVGCQVLPMSNDPVATMIESDEGLLEFQHYFVRRQCKPVVHELHYSGAVEASAAPGVVQAIKDADLVIVAPSNPYLSIAPILALRTVRQALAECTAPRIAVSPIVGGAAVKGPTAKIMQELGQAISNETIADFYASLIDALVIGQEDPVPERDVKIFHEDILMRTTSDKERLAKTILSLRDQLSQR